MLLMVPRLGMAMAMVGRRKGSTGSSTCDSLAMAGAPTTPDLHNRLKSIWSDGGSCKRRYFEGKSGSGVEEEEEILGREIGSVSTHLGRSGAQEEESVCLIATPDVQSGKRRRNKSVRKRLFAKIEEVGVVGGLSEARLGKVVQGGSSWKDEWCDLGVDVGELNLALTLVTGQSFRWRVTGESEFTGVVGSLLVSLRESSGKVSFLLHSSSAGQEVLVKEELRDYLNLGTSLKQLYEDFALADLRFAAVAPFLEGVRLLRQDPLECVFQFICSSNNHIQRIAGMVEYLASLGTYLGSVKGYKFHAFPGLDKLAIVTEPQLRDAGFGYRAKFIVGTIEALRCKDGGGDSWLRSLRGQPSEEVVSCLCSLPGVGPKVAACIALFALDQHDAIPVDTHVWQIAVRYIVPELDGKSLTRKLHQEVAEAFVKRFGKYAGWAHTVLFIAELSSQQALLPEHLRSSKLKSSKARSNIRELKKEDTGSGSEI